MSSLGFLGTPGHSCPHEGTAWEWNCVAGDFITRRECLKLLGVKESIHLFFWTIFDWKHQLGDVLGTFFDEISDGFWRWPRSKASSGLAFDPSGSETRLQSQTPQLFLRFLGLDFLNIKASLCKVCLTIELEFISLDLIVSVPVQRW